MIWLLSGPPGLPVWFILLRCSVLCPVESLYLLYLFSISWFICSGRWCNDKLGVFHANQTSMCFDLHLNLGWVWRCETVLSPPVKYFTDRFKAVLLLWIIYVISVLFLLCFRARLFKLLMPCGHLLGKGLHVPLGSRLWCLIVKLSLCHWYAGPGVVLDCIDSWSLSSFLFYRFYCMQKVLVYIIHTYNAGSISVEVTRSKTLNQISKLFNSPSM